VQLLDVSGLAGAVRDVLVTGDTVSVVGVRDVGERHGDAVLLHLGDLAQGVLGEHAVETGEARLIERIDDRMSTGVVDGGGTTIDRRVDVLGTEQGPESRVTACLVGERIGLRVAVVRADPGLGRIGAVDGDPHEIGLGKRTGPGVRRRDLRGLTLIPLH